MPILEYIISPITSLNIPRSQMPQIKGIDIPEFLEYVRLQGINVSLRQFPVERLKPTQNEINQAKVDAKAVLTKVKPFVVSNTFNILDGHHQLYSLLNSNPKKLVDCWYVQCSTMQMIQIARSFPKVSYKAINEDKKNMNFKSFKRKLAETTAAELGIFNNGAKAIFAGLKKKGKKIEEEDNEYGVDKETSVDRVKEKQNKEKEELKQKQNDDMLKAKEDDFRDKMEQEKLKNQKKEDDQKEKELQKKTQQESFLNFGHEPKRREVAREFPGIVYDLAPHAVDFAKNMNKDFVYLYKNDKGKWGVWEYIKPESKEIYKVFQDGRMLKEVLELGTDEALENAAEITPGQDYKEILKTIQEQ